MINQIKNLSIDFLKSKKTKTSKYKKYAKSFPFSEYNEVLEIIFNTTDEYLFEKIIRADKQEMLIYITKYKEYLAENNILPN